MSMLCSLDSSRGEMEDARAAQVEYERASLACRARRVEEEDDLGGPLGA